MRVSNALLLFAMCAVGAAHDETSLRRHGGRQQALDTSTVGDGEKCCACINMQTAARCSVDGSQGFSCTVWCAEHKKDSAGRAVYRSLKPIAKKNSDYKQYATCASLKIHSATISPWFSQCPE